MTKILLQASAKYAKGTRLLVKVNKEAFLGTVVTTRLGKVYIDCDDGDRLKVGETSKLILGEGIKRKIKKPIKLSEVDSYLAKTKEKVTRKTKTSSIVKKPKERTYSEILNTVSARLNNIKTLTIEKKTFSLGDELLVKAASPIRGRQLLVHIPIYEKAIKKELKALGATFKTVKDELRFTLEGITFILRPIKKHSTNLFIIFRENNHVQTPEALPKKAKEEPYYFSTPDDVEHYLRKKLNKIFKPKDSSNSRFTAFMTTGWDKDKTFEAKITKALQDVGFILYRGMLVSPNRMLEVAMNRYIVDGGTGKGLEPYVSVAIRLQSSPIVIKG